MMKFRCPGNLAKLFVVWTKHSKESRGAYFKNATQIMTDKTGSITSSLKNSEGDADILQAGDGF